MTFNLHIFPIIGNAKVVKLDNDLKKAFDSVKETYHELHEEIQQAKGLRRIELIEHEVQFRSYNGSRSVLA